MNKTVFLKTNNNAFSADICDVVRLYIPVKKIELTDDIVTDGICFEVVIKITDSYINISSFVYTDGVLGCENHSDFVLDINADSSYMIWKKYVKRNIKKSVYELLKKHTGTGQPWGALTGIRPAKFIRELQNEMSCYETYVTDIIDVSPDKLELARRINTAQEPYIRKNKSNKIDVYIGIPFCRSRCSYCSFISREYSKNESLKDRFLELLAKEIAAFGGTVLPYEIDCVYIGGGTPTALNDDEFAYLLELVDRYFPVKNEYTIEAGRPDTINEKKLDLMMEHHADRICINPQTTSGDTLKRIGRIYPSELYFSVFNLARNKGFGYINSDIIFGLPGETKKDMMNTLNDVISLAPENITVHTLAMKNSSFLAEAEGVDYYNADVVNAVSEASNLLLQNKYIPYYLYRQKYMAGNLENTGYAKAGFICEYNIDNMEETTSVIAFGPGAISKRIFYDENRIERACNVKDVLNYCDRIDIMIERKKALFSIDTE